jgi:hypothetical protein
MDEKIVVDIVVYDSYDLVPVRHHLQAQGAEIISEGRSHIRISTHKHVSWLAGFRSWSTVKSIDVVTVPRH